MGKGRDKRAERDIRPMRPIRLIRPIGLIERHGDYGTSRCGGSPFHENSTGWHGLLKRWNENGAAFEQKRCTVDGYFQKK